MSKNKHNILTRMICSVSSGLECYFYPFLDLFIRYWMASIYFKSGLTKIETWSTTLSLFRFEYKVPLIDYEWAAILVTTTEMCSPILLMIGLATRVAAFPMLVMAMVIQFTYLDLPQHYFWMMVLGTLVLRGPSAFSLDYWIAKRFCR